MLKFMLRGLLILMVVCFSATSLSASSKIDKLEDRNPVVKLGIKSIDDNAEKTDSYLGFVRGKFDQEIKGHVYTFIPEFGGKYEKRDDETVNEKYKASLLVEYTLPDPKYGIYGKVSNGKDEAMKLNSENKVGMGLFQYWYKGDKFLVKTRQGLQYVARDYDATDVLFDESTGFFKLGALTGYYYNENMFLKAKLDYDRSLGDGQEIYDLSAGSEFKITDQFALELKYTYVYNTDTVGAVQKYAREISTYLVYNF
jgi:putative salt-induced outer membrane protein YdiY